MIPQDASVIASLAKKAVEMKTRDVDKDDASNYLQRAEECIGSMTYAFQTGNWNSCLINAVHAAISSADAVCVWKLGMRSASDNHADAGRLLVQIDPANEEVKNAVKHLSYLLGLKTGAEYGEKLFSKKEAEEAVKHAERIFSYAKSVVKKI